MINWNSWAKAEGGDDMIDPATLKIAAKAAVEILTDEEKRRKLIIIAVAPLCAFILLVSMIFYTLTMPFQMLGDFFFGDSHDKVADFRIENGYDQYVDTSSEDYINGSKDFSGITFTNGETVVKYFNQRDVRWKDIPYGRDGGTIGETGCGPTSLAIAVSSLTDKIVEPPEMAQWAYENGYKCEGSGSYHSLIPDGAKHFGLTVDYATSADAQKIVDALTSGKLVIAVMGPGHFTTSGHFIVLRGVTADGKILVADPYSENYSKKEWDFNIILNEARKNAGAGGPFGFWAEGSDVL